ncbi:MAG: HEPN domain-containing protein [Desulfovermiculus sp.]
MKDENNIQNKIRISKYSGVISYFDREYVKSGLIHKKFSKWLHRLFDLRQDADYGDMFIPSEEQCREAFQHSREFVQKIRDYYESKSKHE